MTTDLRFLGDWTLWAALPLGLALAAAAWFLYRRETRRRADYLSWFLPGLRALAVFWLFLILTGPVLHHRKVIGELAHLLLFVDASHSMGVTDEHMEVWRKLLIAQEMGWIAADQFDSRADEALDELTRAHTAIDRASDEFEAPALKSLAEQFAAAMDTVADHLSKVRAGTFPAGATPVARFRSDLQEPARQLAARGPGRDPEVFARELAALAERAEQWHGQLQESYVEYLQGLARGGDSSIRNAIQKLETLPRWQRAEAMLLHGQQNLLAQLSEQHHVELAALNAGQSEVLWWPRAGDLHEALKLPTALRSAPTNSSTDLTSGIRTRLEASREDERVGIVLFSDGLHNAGASPLHLAKMLGNRGIPLFTVGLGSPQRPDDLAILEVRGPETVFHEAQVKGEILIKDDMPPGRTFLVRIEHEGRLLWEKSFPAEQRSLRSIPYDFSIKELVRDQLQRQDVDLKLNALPLALKVTISALPGEKEKRNNSGVLRLSAITEKPKVMLIDGRPRWEFRYLRNLFERDQRWEVNALLAGAGGEQRPWARGKEPGQFPPDRETLFTYQLICFGEVPAAMFRAEELEWLREFVERRGGGIVFIDGRQVELSAYTSSPMGALLPVEWKGAALTGPRLAYKLTSAGSSQTALHLVSDAADNALLWAALPPPRWIAPVQALPGSETLLEVTGSGRASPALVFRRFGAGRVLYAGFDESWRWRYEVGDLHHQKFWNQVAKWIMESPFPVQDKYVSLDTGPVSIAPGEPVEIRARLRDAQGRLLLKAKAEAQLWSEGRRVATVALSPDENSGGLFRGRTSPLPEGNYEVRIHVDGLPEHEMKARTEIVVAPQGVGELAQLHCDEELLRQMAFHSGGEYFREEEASRLLARLQPLSQGKIIESETILWQSWWWFVPAILLLTLEWALRKRAGML